MQCHRTNLHDFTRTKRSNCNKTLQCTRYYADIISKDFTNSTDQKTVFALLILPLLPD